MDKKQYFREYYQKNRVKILLRDKKYREKNKDKKREYYKKYSALNKSKIKEKNKKYYQKNKQQRNDYTKRWREKNKGSSKKYYQKNKEKINRMIQIWKEKNPEKVKALRLAQQIEIPKNQLCQICKDNLAKVRHHFNYLQPSKVNFLCRSCHKIIHHRDIRKI